jgi:hypothetical protein
LPKRKKKVLHVDELVVKADKVIIFDEDKKKDKKEEPVHRDPWGWPLKRDTLESSSSSSSSSEDLEKKERRDPWL